MTTKQDGIKLDAMAAIHHAAELEMPLEEYILKVQDYARKRVRMISRGLKEA